MIGTTISHYQIVAELGSGGMGAVYRATDLKLERTVALKFLSREYRSDLAAQARFLHEARAASALDDPNICTIHGIEETADGQLYIVMACYDGETLRERLARGPLEAAELLPIVLQAGQALGSVHQLGIIHRDIKSANILITTGGVVKLLDFGVAKLAGQTQVTRPGTRIGTLHYMSPEQLRGWEVDRRTDIWSLGVVLYEAITGQLPFDGDVPDRVMQRILQADPRPVDQVRPGVPEQFVRAIAGCLQAEPDRRHQSVQALLGVLAPRQRDGITERVSSWATVRHPVADLGGREPYPGLAAYEESDADFFHGREAQVEAVWRKLRHSRLLALAGPSGVGKTSFLRAGLLPARPATWGVLVTTPGHAPLRSLRAAVVRELTGDPDALVAIVQGEGTDADLAAMRHWRRQHQEVLLVMDQFEELFTLCAPAVRQETARLISRLVLEADVRVMLCLRDDFLHHCQRYPGFAPVFDGLTMLGPLSRTGLRRAMMQPALDCGYTFDDPALLDEMIAAVEGERGALPLLAFAMAELWDRRDRTRRVLTREAYERIGTVSGALARHAEAVLQRIGSARHHVVREIFRNLITSQGTRAVARREALLSVFPRDQRHVAAEVLGALIDARLLTSYETVDGEGRIQRRIEVAHESLLGTWPRLVRWQTQDADAAQLRDQLRQAAQLWEQKGRSPDLLWTGAACHEFQLWRQRYSGGLSAGEEAFATAMISRATRRRRRRRLVVAAAFAALVAVLVLVSDLWQRSRERGRLTEALRFEELARDALAGPHGDNTLALALAMAALERGDTPARRRLALQALWAGPTRFRLPGADALDPGGYIAASPDGAWLATGSRQPHVLLFPAQGGDPRVLPVPGAGCVFGAAWSPDGRWLLASHRGADATLCGPYRGTLWDATTLEPVARWQSEDWAPFWFHPTEPRLLAYSLRSEAPYPGVAWWPLDGSGPVPLGSPRPTPPLQLRFPPYYSFTFSPSADLRWLVSWEGHRVFVSAIAGTGLGPRIPVGEHDRAVVAAALDATGALVSSADEYETRVWSRTAPGRPVLSVASTWRPATNPPRDPRLFVSTDVNASLDVHDRRGPVAARPHELRPFGAFPGDPVLLAGGSWVAVGADLIFHGIFRSSREVLLYPWDTVWPFRIDLAPPAKDGNWGRIAPDARSVVMEDDGSLVQVDLGRAPLQARTVFAAPERRFIWCCCHDPAGEVVLAGTLNSGAWLVSLDTGTAAPLVDSPTDAQAVAIGPDGQLLVVGSGQQLRADQRAVVAYDRDGRCLARLALGGRDAVNSLLVRGPRRVLVATGQALIGWDPPCGTVDTLRTGAHDLLVGSRDGFVAVTEDSVWYHDHRGGTGRALAALTARAITTTAMSADGRIVATGHADGTIGVHHRGAAAAHQLCGPGPGITDLRLEPAGRWLAALSSDGVLTWWPVPRGRPLGSRPLPELLAILGRQTNLRVIADPSAAGGFQRTAAAFPGWQTVPRWQPGITDDIFADPPWTPLFPVPGAGDAVVESR